MLVTTPGDVAAATRAIRTVYDGNLLCVRKVTHSPAQAYTARAMAGPMNSSASVNRYRITGGGGIDNDGAGDPYSDLRVLIWTDDVEAFRRTFGSVVKVLPNLTKTP